MIAAPATDPDFALHPVHGEWAQHRFLHDVLPHTARRGLAIDIGAHIGLWTRALAIQFKFVVAFEPVIENFTCLALNATLPNTQLENVALGATSGMVAMELPKKSNSGCWYASRNLGDTPMRTLDSYKFNDVDLIKIDVEGLEGEVLSGAQNTIQRCIPTIVFEENGLGLKHYGPNWIDPGLLLSVWRYKRAGKHGKNEIWIPC